MWSINFCEPESSVKLKLHEATWLAALIDGEGCVQIVCNKPGRQYHHSPSFYFNINVTMCDMEMLERAKAITGVGALLGPYVRKKGRLRPAWRWSVCSQQAAELAEVILPHLMLKKVQAELGIALMKVNKDLPKHRAVKGKQGAQRKPVAILSQQQSIFDQWKAVQTRGKPPKRLAA